ncbi:MAG: AAA family ATPase [Adhaeribacter sp.]
MIQITHEFKTKVVTALTTERKNFTGTDCAFAGQYNLSKRVCNQLFKNGLDTALNDLQWLDLGRKLKVSHNERKWNMARTEVFTIIEEDINFCQAYAKAKICVDDCGIGKTYTAKYLARTRDNCFYVDASQAPTKHLFIRLLARTIGLNHLGKYDEVLDSIKYYLQMLPNPLVIVDEAGDLENPAFVALKGIWNATEDKCGWYMMGADGLREKINKGIKNKKVGYSELFSRYSERYTTIVPIDRQERLQFYKRLITDVLTVNMPDKSKLNEILKRCLIQDGSGRIGGLRRAESLLILFS